MGDKQGVDSRTVSRRTILGSVGGAALGGLVAGQHTATKVGADAFTDDQIDELVVHSSGSLLDADLEPLDDDRVVAVRAAPTAENVDSGEGGDFDAVEYGETPIPLVGIDGRVAGFGTSEFVSDGRGGFQQGNEMFLCNLLDELVDGDRILWDESHDQFHGLESHRIFADYAERHAGYAIEATDDLLPGGAIRELRFRSTASQIDSDGEALTDSDRVLAWAPADAESVDVRDGAYRYGPDEDAPLATIDDGHDVVGVGTPQLFTDDASTTDTRRFGLNVLAELVGEAGTILWDEGHEQFYDLASASTFADEVAEAGYEIEATSDLLGETSGGVELEFFSTASLLDAAEKPLTDDSSVAVWAEPTATNEDANDDGYAAYPDGTDIPLVAVDGTVVGIGAELAPDASDVDANRRFLVDAWTDRLGGTGRVLYDEGHGQSRSIEDYSELVETAEAAGFDVDATRDLAADLDGADLVMITSPADALTDAELDALASFVADGGAVFLHDQADFEGHETDALNTIAEALDAGFRFNTDQVVDEEHSGFAPFVVRTTNGNDDAYPGFFDGADADPQPGLDEADALVVTSPSRGVSDAELDAIEAFVADDGVLVLCDQSTHNDFDETDNLNAIADRLDLAFRFNADQIETDGEFDVVTDRLATDRYPDFFERGAASSGLDAADGVVITSPSVPFTDAELDALEAFVADDGAVVLCNQSDFSGFDETDNLNAIAETLDLAFRFNSDQVIDEERNAGPEYQPVTDDFTPAFEPLFATRDEQVAFEFDPEETYYGKVVQIFDGDTVEVEFDTEYGYRDTIRNVGIDTAETGSAENEPEEWFGIGEDALDHLDEWGTKATEFAVDLLAPEGADTDDEYFDGRHVAIEFDADEPLRGNYGRLLGYLYYDPDAFQPGFDDGDYAVDYNLETIEKGYARVYSSGFARHDEFAALEEQALADGAGIWSAADFDALDEIRNHPVEEVFVPSARPITSRSGSLAADRVPVWAESTAAVDGYGPEADVALAAVDEHAGVVAVSGLLVHEEYEADEEFPVDTSGYGNFPLFTNLFEYVGTADGDVLIDGGHGQFGAAGAISLERCQYYLRYLEGVGTRLRQVNELSRALAAESSRPRAVIVTTPAEPFSFADVLALRWYCLKGGCVVLLGSADAPAEHTAHLNDLAARLQTDLRFGDGTVVDETNNLADDPTIVETSAFNREFPVFEPYFGMDPAHLTYLRSIATDAGEIDETALNAAVSDWFSGDIGYDTLQSVLDAWKRDVAIPGA